ARAIASRSTLGGRPMRGRAGPLARVIGSTQYLNDVRQVETGRAPMGDVTARQNRWRRDVTQPKREFQLPPIPSLEVVYRTEPDALAAALPPPLEPPDEPRVHVRITEIDLTFGEHRHHEMVGFFAVDARYGDRVGEYP